MLSGFYWAHQDITMASKDPNISKQGTAGKRKYVTIMIPQKLEITGMLESGKSQSVVMASHNTGALSMIKQNRKTNVIIYGISLSVTRLLK